MPGRLLHLGMLQTRTGGYGEDDYTRRLPGHPPGVSAICKKPRFSKAQRKKLAKSAQMKRMTAVNAEASVIYHTPELRAAWEARHMAFMEEAKRRGEYEYPRLWDYIRHVLIEENKAAENSIKD